METQVSAPLSPHELALTFVDLLLSTCIAVGVSPLTSATGVIQHGADCEVPLPNYGTVVFRKGLHVQACLFLSVQNAAERAREIQTYDDLAIFAGEVVLFIVRQRIPQPDVLLRQVGLDKNYQGQMPGFTVLEKGERG